MSIVICAPDASSRSFHYAMSNLQYFSCAIFCVTISMYNHLKLQQYLSISLKSNWRVISIEKCYFASTICESFSANQTPSIRAGRSQQCTNVSKYFVNAHFHRNFVCVYISFKFLNECTNHTNPSRKMWFFSVSNRVWLI